MSKLEILLIVSGLLLFLFATYYRVGIIGLPPQDPPEKLLLERVDMFQWYRSTNYTAIAIILAGIIKYVSRKINKKNK